MGKVRKTTGAIVRNALIGAGWALLAIASAGAIHGSIVPLKECGATADPFTSATLTALIYVVIFGVPASIVGAILGLVIGLRSAASSAATFMD